MQIIYNVKNQYIIDVNDSMVEELNNLSEEEIIERMTDVTYRDGTAYGNVVNTHSTIEFELLDEEENSIRYFENSEGV